MTCKTLNIPVYEPPEEVVAVLKYARTRLVNRHRWVYLLLCIEAYLGDLHDYDEEIVDDEVADVIGYASTRLVDERMWNALRVYAEYYSQPDGWSPLTDAAPTPRGRSALPV